MFPVEAARLHPMADGRVERAAALLRQHQREPHGFVENRARRHGTPACAVSCISSLRGIESRAARFDLVKPSKRALYGGISVGGFRAGTDDLDGHQRAHRDFGADGHAIRSLRASLPLT